MTVQWITAADLDLLAPTDWESDQVAAANHWAYTERAKRGYVDLQSTVPNPAVKAGTMMYARLLIATDGSQSGSAHFDAFDVGGAGAIGGDMREVRRLLGVLRVYPAAVG